MDLGSLLNSPASMTYLRYIVVPTLVLVFLLIVSILIRMINKKRRARSFANGLAMSMMDIDKMRKKGLLTDDESKALRHSLAQSEVDKERRRQQAEREKALLAQVADDPEAARLLLNADLVRERRPKAMATMASLGNEMPESPSPSPAAAPRTPAPAPAPQQPVTLAPLPPKPSTTTADLDVLLEKGAISQEEYERLKSFFK